MFMWLGTHVGSQPPFLVAGKVPGFFVGSLRVPGPEDGSSWVPLGSLGPSVGPEWFPKFLEGSWKPQNHMFLEQSSWNGGPHLTLPYGVRGGLL